MSDEDQILMSIRGRYVDLILAGQKDIEIRRRRLNVRSGTRLWIYETLPQARVRATCVIAAVKKLSLEEMWSRYGSRIAISRAEYDNYLTGITSAYGLLLTEVRELESPVSLRELRELAPRFHPPQFYRKLSRVDGILEGLSAETDFAEVARLAVSSYEEQLPLCA